MVLLDKADLLFLELLFPRHVLRDCAGYKEDRVSHHFRQYLFQLFQNQFETDHVLL